ncbi:mesoderm induction early response protein 2 isoform X5 [Sorex araneus]|uniref:mesoderm induction early response protein 2 isoform X5 n=1 Tax=Sorex araneus TaxID=42254 RepID=UPI002433B94C|nr:mesoderm induction early response protein 2 isoform X5 [Sorex araneus]
MAEASPLERQSPCVASCLTHGLCPGQPALQTAAVVPMGSADHRFSLAEILSQSYGVREGSSEAARGPEQPGEEVDKHFGSQRSDMPLQELLALYSYEASDPTSDRDSEGSETSAHLPDMTPDKEQMAKDLLAGEEEPQPSAAHRVPAVTSREAPDLFPAQSGGRFLSETGMERERPSSASSDADEDPLPANKCKKEIMVGPQFQADLSTLHLQRQAEKIYENEDQLLWDPNVLPEKEVEEFLYRAVKRRWHEMSGSQVPEGETVKDSEQALYELVKCRFNAEEALRRLRFNVKVIREGMCAWSEEECRNFEHGFRVHGKNFHLIQANKVRTRSVGECVEYYYLWKKSERYDYFSQQTRLGRRKYGPSGTTDADQDLDTTDPEGPGRPRSSPPLPPGTDSIGAQGEPLAQMRLESPSVHSEPPAGSSGLPSSEPGPCPCPLPAAPPAEPAPQRPPEAFCPPEAAAPEPSPSPSLAVDLAVPGALPEDVSLLSGRDDLNGGAAPAVAPAQVALSVTDFGLLGIGDVNPFLAAHSACPAPGLHSEPLSQSAPRVPSTQPPTWDRAGLSNPQRRGRASPRPHREMDGQMDRAGRPRPCPHQQPSPGRPLTPCSAPSPAPRQVPGQLLRVPNRGAQSHIPRQTPAQLPTSALLSTSGIAALYCPPGAPLLPRGLRRQVTDTPRVQPASTPRPPFC